MTTVLLVGSTPPLPLSLWLSPNSARPACHLQHVVPRRFEMYRSGDGRTIQARHKNGAFLRPLELYRQGCEALRGVLDRPVECPDYS